ncbi:MAG: YncE family protein, partial [Acidimicrobiia bacterium]
MRVGTRIAFAFALALSACTSSDGAERGVPTSRSPTAPNPSAASPTAPPSPTTTPSPTPPPSPTPEPDRAPPSTTLRLSLREVIRGAIAPKSVVASQTGLVFAQNMMYRHTITVYDRRFHLVATIEDAVRLARLGAPRYPGVVEGAPVEAAFSPDGASAYVSNYSMYGPGFGNPGHDSCSPANAYDESFVYRVDVERLRVDRAIAVGSVPKFVAVTPDGRTVLVSNWCSYDLSVIDAR